MGRLVLVFALVALVWLFIRARSPRPDFPPLATSPDDPLLVEAEARARASIGEFLALARLPRQHVLVKLRFVSSSDTVEHLWAEVLSVVSDTELDVRLVTPPVSHTGTLERRRRCAVDDVEDWQVRDAAGRLHGGFSQRAMFAIARRDGVALPEKLLAQEREYGDA